MSAAGRTRILLGFPISVIHLAGNQGLAQRNVVEAQRPKPPAEAQVRNATHCLPRYVLDIQTHSVLIRLGSALALLWQIAITLQLLQVIQANRTIIVGAGAHISKR